MNTGCARYSLVRASSAGKASCAAASTLSKSRSAGSGLPCMKTSHSAMTSSRVAVSSSETPTRVALTWRKLMPRAVAAAWIASVLKPVSSVSVSKKVALVRVKPSDCRPAASVAARRCTR
ncbi:hypothetical protein D9M69_518760 [compost metagenome]